MPDADKDLLEEALEEYELDRQEDQQNRDESADDLKFRAGEQWPDEIKSERTTAKRPLLTINRIPQFVRQVTGDLRQKRPSIKVRPVDGEADEEVAKTYTGLIRHIEYASDAQAAYITAAEHAATCGLGHFRILTEYCDDEGFEQEIVVKRIRNPFSVMWDRNAQEILREDADHCFVTQLVKKTSYEKMYPDAPAVDFEASTFDPTTTLSWVRDDEIRIAEYWKRDYQNAKRHLLSDDETAWDDEMEKVKAERPDVSVRQTREVKRAKVCWWKLCGLAILEKKQEWPGKHIPIVPVVGEEIDIGERIVRHGLVRFAKDPQRLYNYWRTAAAESIALAPKQPFVLTKRQIIGEEGAWNQANTSNLPYLLYTPDGQSPPPQRARPADPPAAMWNEAKIAEEDMHGTTGIYPPSLGQKSNETSGRAILARQREGDTGTFVYADNLDRSIRRAGTIIVDLIPKIYDTQRVIRIVGEDDSHGWAQINVPMVKRDGTQVMGALVQYPGKPEVKAIGDFMSGKYDVTISTGPSYSTKRAESADQLMELMKAVPQVGLVAADIIVTALDLVDGDALAERLRRMPQIAALLPPDPNNPQPAPSPPPPDPSILRELIRKEIETMKANLAAKVDLTTENIKSDTAVRVAQIKAGSDMHGVTLDRDTRLREAAIDAATTAHTARESAAAAQSKTEA